VCAIGNCTGTTKNILASYLKVSRKSNRMGYYTSGGNKRFGNKMKENLCASMNLYVFMVARQDKTRMSTLHSQGPDQYKGFVYYFLYKNPFFPEVLQGTIFSPNTPASQVRERGKQHPRELESVMRENLTISLVHPRRTV